MNLHSTPSERNRDIEVLRAIAVLFVLVEHSTHLYFWGGERWNKLFAATSYWGGVDLFFCISGFVITTSLLREQAKHPSASFLHFAIPFWLRRVFRIWPAAILWLLLVGLMTAFFNKSGSFGALLPNFADSIAAVAQVANFHSINCAVYKNGVCGVNGIYWSLSLEEQFYLMFPFVFFFLDRRQLTILLTVVIGVQIFLARPTGTFMWFVRTDAIALGVLIALAARHPQWKLVEPVALRNPMASILVCLVLLLLIAALPSQLNVVWFNTGLLAAVCGILVYVASFNRDYIFPHSRFKSFLFLLGSRSYALYLTHHPAFFATREIFYRVYPETTFDGTFTLRFTVLAVFLVVIFTEATYRFIEVPIRNFGRRNAEAFKLREQLQAA